MGRNILGGCLTRDLRLMRWGLEMPILKMIPHRFIPKPSPLDPDYLLNQGQASDAPDLSEVCSLTHATQSQLWIYDFCTGYGIHPIVK